MALQVSVTRNPLHIAVLSHLHHPISPTYTGGMEAHTAHLVNDLSSRGQNITLFAKGGSQTTNMHPDVTTLSVLPENYEVRGYPDEEQRDEQHGVLDLAMASAIAALKEQSFDVVINNSLSPIPHRSLRGIPTLHILHAPPLPRIIAQLQEEPVSDELHRYVTVSGSNALQWSQWLPDLRVVSNGIDLRRWASDSKMVVHLGTAAWMGRITAEKGAHIAISAAQKRGLSLSIAGPIQDREYFNELIAPQLGRDVKYLGHVDQDELRKVIGSAQVFISSPLWEEPFGLTTLEAMACGTPVAAIPAGAMAELLGETGGVIARSRDDIALDEAICRAKQLSRMQMQHRASHFSRDRMIDAYMALISEVVAPVQARRRIV